MPDSTFERYAGAVSARRAMSASVSPAALRSPLSACPIGVVVFVMFRNLDRF